MLNDFKTSGFGDAILMVAFGEIEPACAQFVTTKQEAKRFLFECTTNQEGEELDSYLASLLDFDFEDDTIWTLDFEIGGVTARVVHRIDVNDDRVTHICDDPET